MKYDPNETMFPAIGEPVRIEIVRGEEAESAKGRDMLILHTVVCDGQPGAGWESKFYALSFHVGDIMRSVGMDASGPRDVDALTFRGKEATVTFKQEEYIKKNTDPPETKTATKIDRWIPAAEAGVEAAPALDDEPPLDSYQEPPVDEQDDAPVPDDDIPF